MKKLKFYKCNHCGNVVLKLVDKDVSVYCCGEEMEELTANTKEASLEKHLPVVSINGNVIDVKVGSVAHPMEEVHYIGFIALETENDYRVVSLTYGMSPEAKFLLTDSKPIAVYEYCNLHGLWKTELN